MESRPHLSNREIRILRNYGLVTVGILALFFLLQWIRAGVPIGSAVPYRAEIAFLAPLTGESAKQNKQLLDVVVRSNSYFVKELDLKDWNVTVRSYDTGSTPQSFAWAAFLAARNPNTVAILGPLDARQMVAVRNTVRGKDLPVLSITSTSPVLEPSSSEGVYRIAATDDLQGPAIVRYLRSILRTNVFLFVESGAYSGKVLSSFMEAANDQLKLVASEEISANKTDAVKKIAGSQANAIVYLGGTQGLKAIVQELQKTGKLIPIIGVDSLNDPAVAGLLAKGQELYFTSPIAVNTDYSGPYLHLPAGRKNGTYSLPAVQATWFIMEALSRGSEDGLGRSTVWDNLPKVTIQDPGGNTLKMKDGQVSPAPIFIYRGAAKEADWFNNPIDEINP